MRVGRQGEVRNEPGNIVILCTSFDLGKRYRLGIVPLLPTG